MSGGLKPGGVAVIGGGTSGVPAPSRLATDAALPTASSALAGSVARAEDSGRTYLCARTGAATYAWSDAATGDLTARIGPCSGSSTARGITWAPAVAVWGQSGRTLAVGWESVTVPAGIRTICRQGDGSSRGWLLAMHGTSLSVYYFLAGISTELVVATGLTAGAHAVAIAWVDATHLHVSLDGAAATVATFAGTPTATNSSDAFSVLEHPTIVSFDGSQERAAWVRVVNSTLSDATLAIVSGTPSGYRPGDPGAAVVWGWDAGGNACGASRHRLWGTLGAAITAPATTPITTPRVAP